LGEKADFRDARFNAYTDFSDVEFSGEALFSKACFNEGVNFQRVKFSAVADFSEASFDNGAYFNGAQFHNDAGFIQARFTSSADFSQARFNGVTIFLAANFGSSADFSNASFNSKADFAKAIFSGNAKFGSVSFGAVIDFSGVCFSAAAEFSNAKFNGGADFEGTKFKADTSFNSASFTAGAGFSFATFSDLTEFISTDFGATADFYAAIFRGDASFRTATFRDYVYFAGEPKRRVYGDQTQLGFEFAHFEMPDRVSFHTLDLKPGWFVNIDSRTFEFTDVDFKYALKDELNRLKKAEVNAHHRMLSIACRRLADNAEENHRYYEASRLRYSSFEARRIERFRGFVPWRLDWWYWLASGYGESVRRAFIVFLLLIGIFTAGYKKAEFDPASKTTIIMPVPAADGSPPPIPDTQPRRLGWREAALYSFNVSILQKPEPKPKGLCGNLLVSLETVLGPAQAALLALALRRRFMR
jgi:uncharacterized protein YjbI with pentapeptide repeats